MIFCAVFVFCCAGCRTEEWNGPELEKPLLGTDTISNARQLGGYPAADGKRVKDRTLLRSGMLFDASVEDMGKMKEEYGLRVIIDLRTAKEVAEKPDPVIEGVQYYPLPLMEEDAGAANQASILKYTANMVMIPVVPMWKWSGPAPCPMQCTPAFFDSEDALKTWRQFFDIMLLQEEGAVLWHCTGGKDRAGLTAAIVLSVLGVDEETILADFTLTNAVLNEKITYITGEAAKYTSDEEELKQVAALIGVSADHMRMVFDRAHKECGSMSDYVRQKIGLTDEEVQLLRQRYLE